MATLTATWDIRVTLDGQPHVLASPATPPTLDLSKAMVQTGTLATGTASTIFTPNTLINLSAWDFLYYLADKDSYLEFTCNNGDAQERIFAMPAKAQFPFLLFRDDGFYNFTSTSGGNAFTGTLDVLDQIRVYQTSGATMTYSLFLGQT